MRCDGRLTVDFGTDLEPAVADEARGAALRHEPFLAQTQPAPRELSS